MALDWFAACKVVDGVKIECPATIARCFPGVKPGDDTYSNPRFRALWAFYIRELESYIEEELEDEDLLERLYGDPLDRGHRYHTADAIADMPLGMPASMLPPVIQPSAALTLAADLETLDHPHATHAAAYLTFWANEGHPIFASY